MPGRSRDRVSDMSRSIAVATLFAALLAALAVGSAPAHASGCADVKVLTPTVVESELHARFKIEADELEEPAPMPSMPKEPEEPSEPDPSSAAGTTPDTGTTPDSGTTSDAGTPAGDTGT